MNEFLLLKMNNVTVSKSFYHYCSDCIALELSTTSSLLCFHYYFFNSSVGPLGHLGQNGSTLIL